MSPLSLPPLFAPIKEHFGTDMFGTRAEVLMTKGDLLLLSLLGTLTAAVVFATVGWRTGLAIIGLTAAFWIGLAGWWYAVKRLAAACDDDMGEPQTPPDPRTK